MGEFLIRRLESYMLGLTWNMIIENKIKNGDIKKFYCENDSNQLYLYISINAFINHVIDECFD